MGDIALPISSTRPPLSERLLSDERLARLVARGAERAFSALYERHHQAIYRYCRSILCEDQDAQDALQSTMLHAYRALRSRERDLAVRPWLFRIAHNEAISILRRRGPAPASLEVADDALGEGVERTLQRRERLAALVCDLRALPERQRAALVMRELSGLSIAEIAAALQISQGAAKQAVFEARGMLRELAEGRAMECEAAQRAISRRDGRVLRGRRIGSHLRACPECRAFQAAIATRHGDLRALAPPLPAIAATAMLARLLAHGGGLGGGVAAAGGSGMLGGSGTTVGGSGTLGGSGTALGGSGTALGGHLAASGLVKGLAGAAVLALATTGAVRTIDHGGHSRRHAAAVHALRGAARPPAAHGAPGATVTAVPASTRAGGRPAVRAAQGRAPGARGARGLAAQIAADARAGASSQGAATSTRAHLRANGGEHSRSATGALGHRGGTGGSQRASHAREHEKGQSGGSRGGARHGQGARRTRTHSQAVHGPGRSRSAPAGSAQGASRAPTHMAPAPSSGAPTGEPAGRGGGTSRTRAGQYPAAGASTGGATGRR